jgi:Uma2 family endonuclease
MAATARKLATWDDLLAMPREDRVEIVDGALEVMPRPAPPHIESATDLGAVLVPPFKFGHGGGPGGWVIVAEPYLAFGADVRSPDLAGWRKERYVRPERGPYTVVPDWICEVLSPSTAVRDRTEKLPLYARHGVSYFWIVDPVGCSLEVYRLGPDGYIVTLVVAGAEKVRAVPFDAIEIDLALIWGDRLPVVPQE